MFIDVDVLSVEELLSLVLPKSKNIVKLYVGKSCEDVLMVGLMKSSPRDDVS